jgi:hypothetical protein
MFVEIHGTDSLAPAHKHPLTNDINCDMLIMLATPNGKYAISAALQRETHHLAILPHQ